MWALCIYIHIPSQAHLPLRCAAAPRISARRAAYWRTAHRPADVQPGAGGRAGRLGQGAIQRARLGLRSAVGLLQRHPHGLRECRPGRPSAVPKSTEQQPLQREENANRPGEGGNTERLYLYRELYEQSQDATHVSSLAHHV